MNSLSRPVAAPATAALSAVEVAKRRPQRVMIMLPWGTHERLPERSGYAGRSLSNLYAHLLELGA
jgi:hypothetical protein